MLGSVGKMVSVEITQPCRCSMKAVRLYTNEWVWPCAIKLY